MFAIDRVCRLNYLINWDFLSYSFSIVLTFVNQSFFKQTAEKFYKYLKNSKKLDLNTGLYKRIFKTFQGNSGGL